MEIRDNVLVNIDDEDLLSDTLVLNDIFEIAECVFENNKFIKTIEAPNLKKIGNKSFYNCSNLVKINAPLLEFIGDYAFFGTSLTEIDLGSTIEIGKNAFDGSTLNNVLLPKTLKKLGKMAFANNPYLVKADISCLMTKIKDRMFENCVNLKEVMFSNTINKLGIGVFKNCKKLNKLELPEHLKVIETNAFWGCEGLKKVDFNDELEVINDYAFGDTKLVAVDLPDSLKMVGILPFHMCYQLENLKINKLFHDEILDKTNSKLKEIVINNEKFEVLKPIKKIVNYNDLIVIKYNDNSFQILSKPIKYYDQEYFNYFINSNVKLLLESDEIFNIFYWESILTQKELKKINPVAFIALPPNINMIKAYLKKHELYDDIILNNNITNFNSLVAAFKFITIFGGLCKKNNHDINGLINKIGISNLTKQFLNTKVKEFNQNFVDLYLKLAEKYSYKEINAVMPFLYNSIEKVTSIKDNMQLENLETLQFENETLKKQIEFDIIKSNQDIPNYEWLDTTSIVNLLWGYILASVVDKNIDSNEQTRKVLTYYIKDDKGLILASSRAYYSASEKYLLFNSIVLTQSFINKEYSVQEIKSLIVDSVLNSIQDTINFLNEYETIVAKVHVSLSEKSIKEQLQNKGTKIIRQNI